MIILNAEQIEQAADNLRKAGVPGPVAYPALDTIALKDQLSELQEAMGEDTIVNIGGTFPMTKDFQQGFLLGVQAARIQLMTSMTLALARVLPQDVL
jgi:hypothetical protein